MGLKTTYYLRTLAVTQVEKSTVSTQQYGSTHKRDAQAKTTTPIESTESHAVESRSSHSVANATTPQAMNMPIAQTVASVPQSRLHKAPESLCESCE
jgi:hypothetical protein